MRYRLLLALCLICAGRPSAADTPLKETEAAGSASRPAPVALTADDGHALMLWTKSAPSPRRALLLLHGRTWSSLPNFDLQVAGTPRSVMDALAHAGYAAYALDQRGYGASPRDASGWLTPERAARDALQAIDAVRARHPQLPAPVLVGYSQGAMTALLAAQLQPQALSALVLYGFPADIDAPPPRASAPTEPPRLATTAEAAQSDFVVHGAAPQQVIDAYVQQALAADPVRADWKSLDQYRFDPQAVSTPTLLLQGVADGYVKPDALARLFNRLGAADRSWVVLPHSDHAAHVENAQPAWIASIIDFIERPRPALEP
jgi:pimeloyl-ACP methyl ester carboxylesterase